MSNNRHDVDDMADEARADADEWWPAFDPDVHVPANERTEYYAEAEYDRGGLYAAALLIFGVAACAEGIVRMVLG